MGALLGIGEFVLGKPLIALGVVLAFVAVLGGAYLKVRGDGFDAGVSDTTARYEELMAAQKTANEMAVADATAFISTLSNRLNDIAREKANEDALDRLDAAVNADSGCASERVPVGVVQSLNAIE